MRTMSVIAGVGLLLIGASNAGAQAWRDCVPDSMGPGGCDSMGPGGGKSMGPGGGLSMGPGGGRSMGPNGGQSMGPGGGQSMGPGGGKSLTRDRSRGLDPDTLRPYEDRPLYTPPRRSVPYPQIDYEDEDTFQFDDPYEDSYDPY